MGRADDTGFYPEDKRELAAWAPEETGCLRLMKGQRLGSQRVPDSFSCLK